MLAALIAIAVVTLVVVDTPAGHRWVAQRIDALRPENGLRFTVRRIDGSLYNRAVLRGLTVRDPDGLVFTAERVELDWKPAAWIANRLDITSLVVPAATLHKLPRTLPSARETPILPAFDIRIGRLAIDRLTVAPAVTGRVRGGRVLAAADIRRGRAQVSLAADVAGSDTVRMRIDAEPARDRFDIAVTARGAAGGVLSRLVGGRRSVALEVAGTGRWAMWRGRGTADWGGRRVADLALGAEAGAYRLSGSVAPALVSAGAMRRLTTPRMLVAGQARFENRRLAGTASLRSPALVAEARGTIDLGASAWRDLRITARLLRPSALVGTMRGRDVRFRTILDGPFRTARFDYRVTAPVVAFDRNIFQDVRIAGRGRLSRSALLVPVRLTARRITGVGDAATAILGNLSIDGALRIAKGLAIGQGLRLRSDKLAARVNLRVDLSTGRYQIDLDGGLQRYLIPGLGVVDVASTLRVVPGSSGRGIRTVGEARVQVVRLDNAFFRSLAGGLPRVTAQLERGADKILYLRNIVLVAPSLRLTGSGMRLLDRTFAIDARGTQARYGAVTLRLRGRIERPTIDLVLPRPNAALGLADVRAHLDPLPEGYAFRAVGGTRLGAFTSEGRMLLPRGAQASIAIARLDVSGTRAAGTLGIVPGGFAGRLNVAGGGLSGALDLAPAGGVQRITGRIDATDARLGSIAVRRARSEFSVLIDPAGTVISATAQGAGLRVAGLTLARFAGSTDLRGGVGESRAAVSGSRGRGFDIRTVTQIAPDAYRITAQGTLDRRPIALAAPAVLTREGDGWRLAPSRVTFAGGVATVGGRFGGAGSAIDAALQRMPLSVLDIGYPGLGLSGTASGKLAYATAVGAAPSGRIDMTVRGLSRAGLIQSSRPIDLGVTGVLDANRAAMRAVMASGGATIGRAQAVLSPLGSGDPVTRLAGAGLFAQLRYSGPADTLWRLTGIELFDLSGPVAIGADVTGRVGAPVIRGVVRATGARIESATSGTVLTNVQATGRFGGSRLAIDRFTADAGRDGRVTGTGRFEFAGTQGVGMDLSLNADHAVMIDRDDIGATVTGPLTFRSEGRGGTIAGDVRLDRSRYRLGQATATAALPRLSIREINLPDGGVEDDVPRTPWQLAITARAPNNVVVSGLGLSSEWSAQLKIAGQPNNPAITGRADLVRGDVEFAGREFELERGIIRFGGEVPANPALDIEANADSQGLNASIRVTGVAQKPEIVFASTPALPQDELLSRLLFGTSITNLSAPEALQLAAAVSALQDGGNGLNPINAVRRAAGLDRLRILPADPQTGQGTAIAAGKYVTRRLYAEIVSDGQGYSATRVEYQVTRWLSLLSSISTLGRQSANVRVSKDY